MTIHRNTLLGDDFFWDKGGRFFLEDIHHQFLPTFVFLFEIQ